jgi:mono/diheme cytochrome c family protein
MKSRFIILAALLSIFLGACTLSLASDITPPPDYKSPTPGPTMSPLFPQSPPDLTSGAAIFAEKCAPCHGASGLGDGPMAAKLQKPPAALGKPEIGRAAAPTNWYTVVTEGNINSFMPPFKDGLSDQQRWDVVAYAISLGGSTKAEAEKGKALYDVKCAQCHGPTGAAVPNSNFGDQALMAKLTQNDIAGFINRGVGSMPGFGGLISDADIYAMAAYVRSYTVGAAAPAATSTPIPASPTATVTSTQTAAGTPAATAAGTSTAAGTPAATSDGTTTATSAVTNTPAATATATITSTPTQPVGSITGKVVNGSGGSVPSPLDATLHIFEHNTTTQQFSEVATQQAPLTAEGAFSFKDVPMPANRAFYVSIKYADTDYQSDPAFPKDGVTSFDLPVTIYDTTTDTSGLLADQAHILLDYTKPDIVQVVQFYIITNPGKKTVLAAAKGGAVVKISLPKGYTNLQFEQGAIGDRYVKTDDGFADTTPITPGMKQYQIVFAMDMPLPKPGLFGGQKLTFTQVIPVKSNAVSVLVPEGVTVEGANITLGAPQNMGNGATYQVFNAGAFEAGGKLDVSASGAPKGTVTASTGISSSQGIIIGIAAFGLILIAAGAWLFWRDRKGSDSDDDEDDDDDDQDEEENIQDDASSQDELMDAIVALDDQFKAGNISEAAYKERRSELKTKLKKLL